MLPMATRHTLLNSPLIVSQEMKEGFALIEFVREKIRAHLNAESEFPAEVALPLEKFRTFEKFYPDWVAAFNRQFPKQPFTPTKNERSQIMFGMTVIIPKVDP
jgi:hypothetical protein